MYDGVVEAGDADTDAAGTADTDSTTDHSILVAVYTAAVPAVILSTRVRLFLGL